MWPFRLKRADLAESRAEFRPKVVADGRRWKSLTCQEPGVFRLNVPRIGSGLSNPHSHVTWPMCYPHRPCHPHFSVHASIPCVFTVCTCGPHSHELLAACLMAVELVCTFTEPMPPSISPAAGPTGTASRRERTACGAAVGVQAGLQHSGGSEHAQPI